MDDKVKKIFPKDLTYQKMQDGQIMGTIVLKIEGEDVLCSLTVKSDSKDMCWKYIKQLIMTLKNMNNPFID